jgi:hypothetical protein
MWYWNSKKTPQTFQEARRPVQGMGTAHVVSNMRWRSEVMKSWKEDIHALCLNYGMEITPKSHNRILFLSSESGGVQRKA